jgi:hypothetical protein
MISTHAQPGFAQALQVFRQAAHTVPAYAKFLGDNGIDAAAVPQRRCQPQDSGRTMCFRPPEHRSNH